MRWYFTILGGRVHIRVFLNGAKCGDLCFRREEFDQIQGELCHKTGLVEFIPDNDQVRKLREDEQNEI
jgi:hypothetical protein